MYTCKYFRCGVRYLEACTKSTVTLEVSFYLRKYDTCNYSLCTVYTWCTCIHVHTLPE